MNWRDALGLTSWCLDQAQAALWDLEEALEAIEAYVFCRANGASPEHAAWLTNRYLEGQ